MKLFSSQGNQQNQSIPPPQKIQGIPEEVHNDVMEKLVHA